MRATKEKEADGQKERERERESKMMKEKMKEMKKKREDEVQQVSRGSSSDKSHWMQRMKDYCSQLDVSWGIFSLSLTLKKTVIFFK